MLRVMLASSLLSPADLKRTLARRGIFIRSSDKEDTVPVLMTCLLSPREFGLLRDLQRTKEDLPKHRSRVIHIEQASADSLVEIISDKQITRDLLPEFANYKLLEAPAFRTPGSNPDELVLEYMIERTNSVKDWANFKSRHSAAIHMNLDRSTNSIKVMFEYSAGETENLNERILRKVTGQLKSSGLIRDDKQVKRILFSDFDNKSRIEFLLLLTSGDDSGLLRFKQIVNIEMGPDSQQPLPALLKWMEDKVKTIGLRGQQLNESQLIQDVGNHEGLIIETMEAEFEFDYRGEGSCVIQYGFPKYLKTNANSTEFEVNVDKIIYKDGGTYSKKETERFISNTFEKMKGKMYKTVQEAVQSS